MSKRALRPRADVCHLCDFLIARRTLRRTPIRTQRSINTTRLFSSSRTNFLSPAAIRTSNKSYKPNRTAHIPVANLSRDEGGEWMQDVEASCNALLSQEKIPSEEETTRVLAQCEALATLIMVEPTEPISDRKDRAGSALLDLDDPSGSKTRRGREVQLMEQDLSKLVYSIITHPPVFITPKVLDLYVKIQEILKDPQTLPEAFRLYANKPLPVEGSSPIRYTKQNPDKVANAIPQAVADRALQVAVDAKDLTAAIDIIDFSYATKAFRRAKFVRLGLVPSVGLTVAPVAAYGLASQLALLQTTMETGMATNVAFAGMVAYVGFTATIGIVALTTANDQMDRVTWAPGLPLRQRWIREEERAAFDKVAGAWGFREQWRRGEEEGKEWDFIRDWIGVRGMVLDRTELMEGME
ncbi:Uncharacterized protein BP5553_01957 [Venustampulla echinocandica]|uniref:Uncharacterized protein n=1 Tax=Venustampulla echinocandica TaxID=2656787 RepID=A0A370U2H2_9HELO|nr:Uncharacterized protein BP5553_01957 [Venustampulla echinocandica]RDL41978.1 Uncharacterized protein BP5553_01957 [Venustampulla echinocandica]